MKTFLEKRVPKLQCREQLEYWEWVFATFDFPAFLNLPAAGLPREKAHSHQRTKFGLEAVKHLLGDPLFFFEISNWIAAVNISSSTF